MINSLYGRMGMSSIDNYSFIIKEEDLENYEYLNIISMKKVNKIILLNIELDNKIKNSIKKINYRIKKNISIASSITSKSRIKLYKAQKEVIKNKGRLLYSDTDSIFAAYKRDVSGEKQGEIFWDISKKDTKIKKAVFISPKSYSIIYNNGDEITKIKGYDQNKIKFRELEKNFYYGINNIELEDNKMIDKKDIKLKFIKKKKY